MSQCLDEQLQPFFSACAVSSLEIYDPCLATLSDEGRVTVYVASIADEYKAFVPLALKGNHTSAGWKKR